MSLHEELRAAQRCVDDLARCVSRLELRGTARPKATTTEPIRVPDAPYDHGPRVGADDEGPGCHRS